MIHPAEFPFSLERRQGAERADFVALLRSHCPEMIRSALPQGAGQASPPLTHGTTILAARYDAGVLIAGDRQATAGNEIAEREIEKVMEMDGHSAVAIAGVAGPAAQMAKLLQTQIEFYEKVEGIPLSLEGKANYLTHLVRQNLPAAMQGFVVAPLFAGYDLKRKTGRIFKYDAAGGQYEERAYCATGSGGKEAYIVLKKRCKANMTREDGCPCGGRSASRRERRRHRHRRFRFCARRLSDRQDRLGRRRSGRAAGGDTLRRGGAS